VVDHLLQGPHDVAVNAITLSEVHSGVNDVDRPKVDHSLSAFEHWTLGPDIARMAGQFRWHYRRLGRPLTIPDVLMAAHAIEMGATLVTDGIRDFPMPELSLLRSGDPLP